MTASRHATSLIALRLAIGAGMWGAPRLTARAFGVNLGGNEQAVYLGRLFAIRDVALAAGALASDSQARRLWWRLGIVCDLADAAAGVLAGRSGAVPKVASAMVTGTALTAAAMGASVLASE